MKRIFLLLLVATPLLTNAGPTPDTLYDTNMESCEEPKSLEKEEELVGEINMYLHSTMIPEAAKQAQPGSTRPTPTPSGTGTPAPLCPNGWCVICLTAEQIDQCHGGAGAFCSPAGGGGIPACSIILTQSMCRALKIPFKKKHDLQALTCDKTVPSTGLPGLRDTWRDPTPAPNNRLNCYVKIRGACIAAEEIQHAIDFETLPLTTRKCEREIRGDNPHIDCLQHYINLYCNITPPALPADQCERLKRDVQDQQLQTSLNQCICNQTQGAVNCETCRTACVAQCGGMTDPTWTPAQCEDRCRLINDIYCVRCPNASLAPSKTLLFSQAMSCNAPMGKWDAKQQKTSRSPASATTGKGKPQPTSQ